MSSIISSFQMKSNRVVEFKLNQKDASKECETINVSFKADYLISDISEEDNFFIAKVDLLTSLKGKTDYDKEIFEIILDMQGVFTGDAETLNEEQFNDMLSLNGVSTLMQLSRAFVTSSTALSGFDRPINFPMINVFELNKLKKKRIKNDDIV